MLKHEIEQQLEWNKQLEKELISKQAQIEALSKIHNDFTISNSALTLPTNAANPQIYA